jgi:hypothetical protein
MGTALLPWYTLSSRVTASEISLSKECLFSGENWDCQQPHMRTPAEDTGAISWQEIPAGAFFHNSASTDSSKYPKWNPFIGSGYPIFLDGISRTSTPSRILLNLFPTDGTRDFIIFFRFLMYTWGVVFSLMLLGCSGFFLLFAGISATLAPYASRYLDMIYFDVDLMAPWVFAFFLLLKRDWKNKSDRWLSLGGLFVLGAWIGMQSFIQAQAVFGVVTGVVAIVLLWPTRGRSLMGLACFSLPFLATSLPYILEFKGFFQDLVSTRSYVGCVATGGVGLQRVLTYSYLGYLKSPELETIFTVLSIPLLAWAVFRKAIPLYFFAAYILLGILLIFGMPNAICSIDGLSATHFSRNLVPHLQSYFLILASASLWAFSAQFQRKKVALTLGFVLAIYPSLSRSIVSTGHILGKYAKNLSLDLTRIPDKNVYAHVKTLSQSEDRRHFSPDGRLVPNYSAALSILDMRVIYGVYPKRFYTLNDSLFHAWYETPSYGHPDRFIGGDLSSGKIPVELEKILILNRVSLLTFSKNVDWLKNNSFYTNANCEKRKTDELADFYLCQLIDGVGFFPKTVAEAKDENEALALLAQLDPIELVDFAVIEPGFGAAKDQPVKAAKGSVVAFKRSNDQLGYTLNVTQPGFFLVADAYFPGWRATVNGNSSVIHPANVAFKAVWVPQGKTLVSFIYTGDKNLR